MCHSEKKGERNKSEKRRRGRERGRGRECGRTNKWEVIEWVEKGGRVGEGTIRF